MFLYSVINLTSKDSFLVTNYSLGSSCIPIQKKKYSIVHFLLNN